MILIGVYLSHTPATLWTDAVAVALDPSEAGAEDNRSSKTLRDDMPVRRGFVSVAFADEPPVETPDQKTVNDAGTIKDQMDEMAAREKFLARRESQLLALQQEINDKIEQLTRLRDEIREERQKEKTFQEKEVKHLIKIYSAMKPQRVAELVSKLDIDLTIELFSRMKGDVVGKILSFVDTDTGARITEKLFPGPLAGTAD